MLGTVRRAVAGADWLGEDAVMRRIVAFAAGVGALVLSFPSAAAAYGESRCRKVPATTKDAIAQGVESGLTLRKARAVRSDDFKKAFFISVELDAPGLEGKGDVGTWVTNRLKGGGLIYSVDAVASEFSDWGEGGTTDAGFSMSDDGADESRSCL
jgi:hypothetical protein